MVKRIRAAESEAENAQARTSHLFKKGHEKRGGRQKGTPNKHTAILKECIMTAMQMVGNNNRGKSGAEGYLAWLAWKHPEIFGRLLEKLLPFSLSGAGGGPVQVEYTSRDEITLRLKERGLPLPTNLLAPPSRKPMQQVEVLDDDDDE